MLFIFWYGYSSDIIWMCRFPIHESFVINLFVNLCRQHRPREYFCPTKLKRSICISDFMQTVFFYLEKSLKKLADDQYSFKIKESIYHIKHMYIQHFTTVVDWAEIRCVMEVSTTCCRYCVFTWYGRLALQRKHKTTEVMCEMKLLCL